MGRHTPSTSVAVPDEPLDDDQTLSPSRIAALVDTWMRAENLVEPVRFEFPEPEPLVDLPLFRPRKKTWSERLLEDFIHAIRLDLFRMKRSSRIGRITKELGLSAGAADQLRRAFRDAWLDGKLEGVGYGEMRGRCIAAVTASARDLG